MGAVQSVLFAFTAIAIARMYTRRAVDPEPITTGEIHASDSGGGTNTTTRSEAKRVASTTDRELTSTAADQGPPSAPVDPATPAGISHTAPAVDFEPHSVAVNLPRGAASEATQAAVHPEVAAVDIAHNHPPSATVVARSDAIANHNTNYNALRGVGNTVNNNNSNMNLGPGASVRLVNYFHAPAPNPWDEMQTKIARALKDRYVPEAVYAAQLDGGCMPGTRVQILSDIENWIRNFASQKIFWLAGMAGMGKTAIGQTACSHLREQTDIVLGGSFFCSRSTGSAGQCDVRCIIPTLAQLLAKQSAKFSEALAAELKRDPEIPNHRVSEQVKHLLYKPLLALRDSHVPIIFVIDALDECGGQPNADEATNNTESHRIVSEMLQALVDFSRSETTLPVKFLVTSRPETHIRDTPVSDATFSSILHLHTVNKEQVTADIRLYISTQLSSSPKLRTRFTDDDVDMLARLCDGLFIVATTALKHILGGGFDAAASRFMTLLNSTRDRLSSGAAAPLDRMYSFILMDATRVDEAGTDELQQMLNLLAALLCTRMKLSINMLADLLGVKEYDVRARLARLHAVVHVPDDNDESNLRTLHASFGDYLIGRAPSNIQVSGTLGHELLAHGCLRVMTERLCFNVSQCRSSYERNQYTRPNTITPSLEYACLQWIYHVAAVPVLSEFDVEIDVVFKSVFLFWLEVMSVLGAVWRATSILFYAASMVRLPELSTFFHDANAFVTSSHEAIQRSASHIYLSALPFTPKDSLVYQTFAPLLTGLVSFETFGIDRHGGSLVMILTGHEKGVTSIEYSSDGHRIVSGSRDGTVRIWDTRTGEEIGLPMRSGDGEVHSVALSPNGNSVAAGTEACVVCIWSLQSGQAHLRRLSGHSDAVLSVAFSPDGAMLVSASADKSLRLWREETGAQVAVFNGHTGKVKSVAFAPNGETIASGSEDRTIRLWHVATGRDMGQPLTALDEVGSLCFSADGEQLVSGLETRARGLRRAISRMSNRIELWDLKTRMICSILTNNSPVIRCVQFSSDGRSVVSAADEPAVRIWAVPQNTTDVSSNVLDGHTGNVRSASFSPDGLYIASGSDDYTIRIWNAGSGQQAVQPLSAHDEVISSVAVSPCGGFIVSGSDDCSVRVWNMQTGEPRFEPLLGHTDAVYSVTISSDGRLIASASRDRTIRLWDARTGEAIRDPLTGHGGDVRAVAFSAGARWLASGSDNRTIRIWNVKTRQPSNIAPLRCTGAVLTVAFSPDGRLLAAGDNSGRIYLWHANRGQSVCKPLRANGSWIRSIVFSADGAQIVSGGSDKMIRVWDVNTRQQLLLLEGHSSWVRSVAVSSDGKFICSGSDDRTVRLWNSTTGTPIATLRGHTDFVFSVALAPDGRSVVSCSKDKTIRVCDVDAACFSSSSHTSDPAAALASATLNNGWLVGPSGELLVWVPENYRKYLQLPPCTMRIDQRRIAVTLGDDGWHCGTNWTSCWRRNTLSHVARIM